MNEKREHRGLQQRLGSRFFILKPLAGLVLLLSISSCSLFKTRPVQEMSDTAAAMKAAKEAQADLVAPVLYREANEWWQKAKAEYKYKNFEDAELYAIKARKLAEQAEFETIKNPGQRTESTSGTQGDSAAPTPVDSPYAYPTATSTPYDRAIVSPGGGTSSTPTPGNGAPTPQPSGL